MKLHVLFGAAAAIALFPVSAMADYYEHNGSLMYMAENDAGLIMTYSRPKSSIAALGVVEGTILFQGNALENNSVNATAYLFKRGCQPAPYDVEGRFVGENLKLSGYAPIRAKNSCQVISYERNKNSVLFFKFLYHDPE